MERVKVISATTQEFNGKTYKLFSKEKYFSNQHTRLHRKVWEYYNGTIPKGYHIHHKDDNRSNNQIENLDILPSSEHLSMHSKRPERIATSRESIKKAILAAPKWHMSKSGNKWHKEHYQKIGKHILHQRVNKVCAECNQEYQGTLNPRNRFCSNKCKQRHYWKTEREDRTCAFCGKKFNCARLARSTVCNASCKAHLMHQNRKAK